MFRRTREPARVTTVTLGATGVVPREHGTQPEEVDMIGLYLMGFVIS